MFNFFGSRRRRKGSLDAEPHGASPLLRPPKVAPAMGRVKPVRAHDGARRVLIVGRVMIGLVTLIMLVLLGRVVQLQCDPPAPIAELVNTQYSNLAIEARRGSLRARDGAPLAITQVAQRLFVDPALIEEPASFSERVAFSLDYDPAQIERTISERMDRRFVVIDRRLSPERLARLPEIKLAGLATQPLLVREYPQGALAAAVIGFVGFEGKGLEGLERSLESQLKGTPGEMRYLRDASRRPLWVEQGQYEQHQDGQTIYLTLDIMIQAIAEEELLAACEKYGARSGELIVMNPHTGEILAMANYPSYDPNNVSASAVDARRNRCVTDVFEPGSIFKPFIWSVATAAGHAHPSEVLDAHDGFYVTPKGRRLRDAHGYSQLTWEQALVKSSNIVMAIVGQRMGSKRLHDAVLSFGFGTSTGSELPGEVSGQVHPLKRWTHYSETSVPMGQEIGVTPLQIVRAFCTFANDGVLVRPTILLPHQPGQDLARPLVYQRVLSPAAAEQTRWVMRKVVTDGTGRNAKSDLYAIFGKTGTAQISGPRGGYLPDQYVGSFVGGAPVEAPQIVVGCFIHRPNKAKGYYGGIISAPAARNVIERSLQHMGVPPQTLPSSMAGSVVLVNN